MDNKDRLWDRVDELEEENTTLKAENRKLREEAKAAIDHAAEHHAGCMCSSDPPN